MTPQELKNSILQLAIQGKLVEQRPEEGTAEELYRQIQAEKQALIKAGKIKKEKPLPEITEDEKTFVIPESWRWVRLNDLCRLISDGTHKTPTYVEKGIPFLSVKDISAGFLDFSNTRFISQNEHQALIERCKPEKDDVLICRIGTLGKAVRINTETEFSIFVSLGLIKLIEKAIANYVVLTINSGYGYSWIQRVKVGGGTHTFKINLDDLRLMPIPLPPFAEQMRIIEKCNSFSGDFERYEKAWCRLEDFNKRFPGDMQKSILQMAIQGKLVEQRPEEGTGEELYRQIQAEKQALIKAGKNKKEKPLPEIKEDEIPFEIPESWKWVRLSSVVDLLSGFAFKSEDFKTTGKFRLLRGINLGVNEIRWKETVFVDSIPDRVSDYLLCKGDVLLGLDRPWISDGTRVAVFDDAEDTYLVQRVLRIRSTSYLISSFVSYILHSSLLKSPLGGETTGISVPHISPNQVGSIVIPLPPLFEQKRIVARLEELLPLCEKLK